MDRIFSKPASHFRHIQRKPVQPIIPGQSNDLWRYQILDPDGDIASRWNYIFLITTLVSLCINPLYFYLPFVLGDQACMSTDSKSAIAITSLRTIADLFYVLHMLMKFRTAFVAPSSRVFGRGELIMDAHEIAMRYLKSDFIIDLAAMLPLPQTISLCINPLYFYLPFVLGDQACMSTDSKSAIAITSLRTIADLFYVLHMLMKFRTAFVAPSSRVFGRGELIMDAHEIAMRYLKSDFIIDLAAMLPLPQIAGASWYLSSIGRQHSCWKIECKRERRSIPPCYPSFLDCNSVNQLERRYWLNATHVLSYCDGNNQKSDFKFGMFADVFTSRVSSAPFRDKALYCLWWGLRSLSSYGTNLETSTFLGETSFCILLCIAGLILFAQLIGNTQTYLSSMTVRVEEWRIKRRDTEEWMRHRQLPLELQERVCKFVQYRWFATRGVNEESILWSFPTDLRREIQRHQCLNLVRRVPFFSQMDDILLDAICKRLISSLCTQGTYIVREGDLVNEMLFIIRGKLNSSTTNGGQSGFFNSITLGPGNFCGEELLTWALMPTSTLNLPSSTRTVCTFTEVEAFALRANDLRFVSSQFNHLHSKRLQHAFRYYSHQWRTWAACFVQAAWRRYKRRKLAMELALQENLYYLAVTEQETNGSEESGTGESSELGQNQNGTNVQHLQATFLASKFAANTRRGVNNQKVVVVGHGDSGLKLPRFAKQDEPDFSSLSSKRVDY